MNQALPKRLLFLVNTLEGQVLSLLCIMLFSVVYSMEFLTSQAMFFLAGVTLFERKKSGRGLQLRKGNRNRLQTFKWNSAHALLTIPFFLAILSMAWSSDWSAGLRWIQLKLPFFVLPVIFMMLPKWNIIFLKRLLQFTLLLLTISCIPVLVHYLLNMEDINLLLSQGQHVPVPSNHIRFSMMVSIALLSGIVLIRLDAKTCSKLWKSVLIGSTVFLFVMLHVLSVRTGLLLFYSSALFLILVQILQGKSKVVYLGLAVLVVGLPFIAYQTLPSFQSKINYVLWDLGKFKEGRAAQYSDSERIISLQVGLQLFKEAPLIGVGAGDLKPSLKTIYAEQFPNLKMKLPHAQFITVAATYGLLGLFLFLAMLIRPIIENRRYRYTGFLGFNLFMYLSMCVESTLDTNYGITIYLVFLLAAMQVPLDKWTTDN